MTKRVLLVCPRFFGYETKIAESLSRLSYEVDFIDERPSNSVIFKIIQRLGINFLIKKIIYRYFMEEISKLEGACYDVALFINIESVDKKILKLFNDKLKLSNRILYMWDSSKNKPNFPKLICHFDKVATFDPIDSKRFCLEYIPLFYSKRQNKIVKKSFDISFIGTAHSDRYKVASEIIKTAHKNGLKTYSYFYYPSRFLFLLRCIFDSRLNLSAFYSVNYSPMPYDKYCDVIESSKYVLDINHPDQSGLTMRTLEALGVGAKVLTTNFNIKDSELYKKGYVAIVDRKLPTFNSSIFRKDVKVDVSEYYIDNWVVKLIASKKL
ncbi:CgeB family protein [Citrobacter freundii]|uniref:glycosyltransferase n=1 Tax=Citrobacter freundii TaxID=546 RepID=UPI0029D43185|nr:glycosyltransferase [Citrobacter freundii]MDX6979501.1 glycosyltransferase [Citrobacter freundii]